MLEVCCPLSGMFTFHHTNKTYLVVKSRGHIAAHMFRDDKYIESQLMLISPNRIAQYWVGYGHISFYERVNIDQFLSPFNDPPPKCP